MIKGYMYEYYLKKQVYNRYNQGSEFRANALFLGIRINKYLV